ncbi:substrate-binding domain-containing protein [Dyella psychrodurans]|uniref:ABC transporter substrate-binding protein n=1 Tax=Dyella psychrodurans TaxID=1927960 RepID=A0A370X7Q7_9GAMM|nr:substrate-binding domain-containing protein [Dyella psychrodurans]RDS84396.1 ABC transporter substrate-binding protein [Dyella psychrodurans]
MKVLLPAVALLAASLSAHAAETLHVYGPGGPAPAMQEAAAAFGKQHGIDVQVTAGPTPKWAGDMQRDGDVVYSGSEAMMSDFLTAFNDQLLPETVRPLYLRPAGILVRPGNPRHIGGFRDLLHGTTKVMVVNGAGQVGMWEDIAGRDGDISTLSNFRSHIAVYARNSAEAVKAWKADPSIDAWIIFPIWSVSHPGLAQVVPLESRYRVYRDSGVVLTKRGDKDPQAQAFVAFLASDAGKKIFEKYGWTTTAAP